jgi:hypothetical protein
MYNLQDGMDNHIQLLSLFITNHPNNSMVFIQCHLLADVEIVVNLHLLFEEIGEYLIFYVFFIEKFQ